MSATVPTVQWRIVREKCIIEPYRADPDRTVLNGSTADPINVIKGWYAEDIGFFVDLDEDNPDLRPGFDSILYWMETSEDGITWTRLCTIDPAKRAATEQGDPGYAAAHAAYQQQ